MRPGEPIHDPERDPSPYRPGPHRVASLAAILTLPLLYVGGSVTSYGVGMAVPDWPTTFGINMFLYNFWNEPFGVQLEHSHRLYGAAVGLATLVLAAWLLAFDRRRWVKALGVVALLAVIAQGVMGGLRVNQISTPLAALHGGFGQAFFGLIVALVVVTGRVWREAGPRSPDPSHLRLGSLAALLTVYGQIAVGAWYRHFRGLDALAAHVVLAVVVLGVSHALASKARRHRDTARALVPSARTLAILATLQVALGLLALWLMLPLGGNPRTPTLWEAMTRTAHQTNGALLLASSVVLALRAHRHLGPRSTTVAQGRPSVGEPRRSSPLEVVA
ncbi:MAG: heme A synthase [Isosphaeraceae bacterium]